MSLKINNLLLSSMEIQTREILNSVNIKKNILVPNSVPTIVQIFNVGKYISWEINPNLLTSIVLVSNFKNIITNFTVEDKLFFIIIHSGKIEDEDASYHYGKQLDYNQLDIINDTQILEYFTDSGGIIQNSKYYLTIGVSVDTGVIFNEHLPPILTFFNY